MVLSTLRYRPKSGCVFEIVYETDWRIALCAYERFTRASVMDLFPRQDNYHADTIKIFNANHRATPGMYDGQPWQKGHLICCADWAGWAETMDWTFIMSNIVPQEPDMNMHVWSLIERFGRLLLRNHPSVFAATGTIFEGPVVMMNQIRVPSHMFKVFLCKDFGEDNWHMYSFRVPNVAGEPRDALEHYVDLDVLEAQTGFNFNVNNYNIVDYNSA